MSDSGSEGRYVSDDRIVGIRVGPDEKCPQRQVRAAGGLWDRTRRLWLISHDKARALDLEGRVVRVAGNGL